MKIQSLAKSSLLYTAGNILAKGVGILLLPLYTKYLSTHDYGIIELVELVVNVASMVFGIGMVGGAMVRVFYDYSDKQDKNQVISTSIFSTVGMSVFACLVGIWLAPFLATVVLKDPSLKPLLMASFAAVIFSSVFEVCLVYIRLIDRPLLFVLVSMAQLVLTTGMNIYFIAFKHYGVWGFVLSKLLIISCLSIALIIFVFQRVGIAWHLSKLKQMIKFGAPLVGASLAFFVIHFSDRFFLSRYGTLEEVGIYSLGYKFGFMITYLVGEPFGRAWGVSLFAFIKQENWKFSFARVFFILLVFLILAWAALSYWNWEIVQLLANKNFWGAGMIIPGVALAYVVRECGDFFRQLLFINKRTRTLTLVTVVCALANLVLNYFLIQRYQAMGAMAATLATWILYCGALFIISQREFSIPYNIFHIFKLIGMAAFGYILKGIYEPQNIYLAIAFHTSIFIGLIFLIWNLDFLEMNEKAYVRAKSWQILQKLKSLGP